MLNDFKTAIRSLRAAPGFTAVALIVLTLGIGASTAIFSVVDAVVLRALPFDESDRLVSLVESDLRTGLPWGSNAPQNYLDWREQQQVFTAIAAIGGGGPYTIRGDGEPEQIRTRQVTHELFSILRVAPMMGRTFTIENEVDGNHRVAVIGHGLWQRRFGANPAILGRTMALDNGVFEIIGVMPPGFTYPVGAAQPADMWVPYVVPADERVRGDNRSFYLQILGRLKDGVSLEQAQAQIEQVTRGMAEQSPTWFTNRGILIRTQHETLVGRVRDWMLLLLGAVTFVLLIACVNVANLMLARGTARSRDIAIRAALGANRWRLARALLVESVVLSMAGTLLGIFVAWGGVALLRATMPGGTPRMSDVGVDLRVLAAAAGAAITTGLCFGLLPAIQFSRPNLTGALREGGRSGTAGVARQRLRGALVVAEVALAVILLVGSGLFVSSFARLVDIDIGIDHHNVLTLTVPQGDLRRLNDLSADQRRVVADLYQQTLADVLDRVQRVRGVELAAIHAGGLPLSGSRSSTSVQVPGNPNTFSGDSSVDIRRVSPDYHAAMRIPLLAGRLFTEQDRQGAAPVIILSDVAAKLYFEGKEALGSAITIRGDRTVVGLVGAVRLRGPESELTPEAYIPMHQAEMFEGQLVARTTGDPVTVYPEIRSAFRAALPAALVPQPRTMEEYLDGTVAQRRFNMLLFSLFGVLGLVIAAVGIYGVMAYIVERRTSEIGVRMALGALPGNILRSVLGRAGVYLVIGVAVGLAAAWKLSVLVEKLLFRVTPTDPFVYAAVTLFLITVGLFAAFVPARRASRVDPLIALRAD